LTTSAFAAGFIGFHVSKRLCGQGDDAYWLIWYD